MENLIKELLGYVSSLFIGALIVMLSWNYLMTDLFNLESVSYWQSLVMLILTGNLFKTGSVSVSNIKED